MIVPGHDRSELTARDRRAGRWLFALALGVYVLTAGGSLTTSDAVQSFDLTRNIVEDGSLALSDNVAGADALRGRDGRFYSPFGILPSLVHVPFYLAGKTALAVTGRQVGKPDTVPKAVVALAQTLVGATIVWQIFRLATLMTGAAGASLLAALTFAFGSVLWPYARFGFHQPLACVTLIAAVEGAWVAVRRAEPARFRWSALWLAAGLLTRHELGLAIVPVAAWLWWAGQPSTTLRWQRLRAFLPVLIAGLGVWLALNAYRFGHPFDTGHLRDPVPGFGSPVLEGVLGLLFSPSASIFLYSPVAAAGLAGLVFRLWPRDRATTAWLLSTIVMFLLFYATLGNWIGGRSYGSRYLLIVLPFLAIGWASLLASLRPKVRIALGTVMLAVGILVQLPGVVVDYAKVSQAATAVRGPFTTIERQWSWEASPLALNARAALTALPANLAYVAGWAPIPVVTGPASEEDRGFSQQFAFSLDFWWLYLFYMGVLPRWAVLAVPALGFAWTLICLAKLRGA